MANSRKPKPWERQPGEPVKAHEAAQKYFELGPERSIPLVRGKFGESSGDPPSIRYLERLSGKWAWVDRADAWDRHQDEILAEAEEREFRRHAAARARHRQRLLMQKWEASQKVFLAARSMLDACLDPVVSIKTKDGQEVVEATFRWSPRDIPSLLKSFAELGDSAVGLDKTEEAGAAAVGPPLPAALVTEMLTLAGRHAMQSLGEPEDIEPSNEPGPDVGTEVDTD